jgi:hypothetical protein
LTTPDISISLNSKSRVSNNGIREGGPSCGRNSGAHSTARNPARQQQGACVKLLKRALLSLNTGFQQQRVPLEVEERISDRCE